MRRLPLLIGSLLPLLVSAARGQDIAAPSPDTAQPPARVARLSYLQGDVSFQAAGDSLWTAAILNYPVTTGDRLFAGGDARAEVQAGPYTVRLAEYADLTVVNLTDHLMQLGLTQGAIRVSVYHLSPDDSVEVDTPHGALVLLAAGDYRVDASQGDSGLEAGAERGGSFQWTAGGVAQNVASGQAILVSGMDPIQVASVAPPAPDAFDRWSAARDGAVTSSVTARYVSSDVPGYQDLDDAGTWAVTATYGPVWYPGAIPAGWVPYRFGRWVWVSPWGWTWVENAHWGYVPFHYGRWVLIGARWAWIPGPLVPNPCYAPALVVFVEGGSFGPGAQGWIPLGPGEPYYPWYDHDPAYLRRVNLTNLRRVRDPAILTDDSYITRIQYRNRAVGTTVVSGRVFRSGESLVRRTLRVKPSAIAGARIARRPLLGPTPRELAGGPPERRPPAPRRPSWIVAPAPGAAAPPSAGVAAGQPRAVPRGEAVPDRRPVLITRTPPPGPERRAAPERRPSPRAEPARTPVPRAEPARRPAPQAESKTPARPPAKPQDRTGRRRRRPPGDRR